MVPQKYFDSIRNGGVPPNRNTRRERPWHRTWPVTVGSHRDSVILLENLPYSVRKKAPFSNFLDNL